MRHLVLGAGVVAMVVGVIWMGQGAGLLPGSFMTGDPLWLLIGLGLFVVGLLVVLRRVRPGPRRR